MAGENDLTSQFQKAFQSMTATQKAMVGAILAIAILALAGLGHLVQPGVHGDPGHEPGAQRCQRHRGAAEEAEHPL